MIEWTDEALEQVVNRIQSRKSPGVRLALLGGGCAGFKYDFSERPIFLVAGSAKYNDLRNSSYNS